MSLFNLLLEQKCAPTDLDSGSKLSTHTCRWFNQNLILFPKHPKNSHKSWPFLKSSDAKWSDCHWLISTQKCQELGLLECERRLNKLVNNCLLYLTLSTSVSYCYLLNDKCYRTVGWIRQWGNEIMWVLQEWENKNLFHKYSRYTHRDT